MSIITLTTDFGTLYPASMKAVILNINRNANIVDITHSIPQADIRAGAFALYSVVDFFPKGSVHVAVVDPGVGTERRAIAIKAGRQYFVGPDNGLMIPAAKKLGEIEVYDVTNRKLFHEVSHTFHGRDIFAPVGGYLSRGFDIMDVGERINDPVDLEIENAQLKDEIISGEVLFTDDFGNVITNIPKDMVLGIADYGSEIEVSGRRIPFLETYGNIKIGEPLALIGSHGFFELSVNQGSGAEVLKLKNGDRVEVKTHFQS